MQENLLLGVAREIITPKIGCELCGYGTGFFSDSVADDLTATAFYFEQGETKALMVSLTVCSISTTLSDDIRAQITTRFNIPESNIMLCCTHTHTGPRTSATPGWGDVDREYCDEIFVPRILHAVECAVQHTQSVSVGVAHGDSLVGINRRELNFENQIVLGQNPWGSFDKRMTVIAFKDENGKNVANMIHYGAHCTSAGNNPKIGRDWAGVMIDALEAESGAVTAFFNGTEGDVGPRLSNGKTTGNMDSVAEIGAVAAKDAVRIYQSISEYGDVTLAVSATELSIPLKKRLPLEVAEKELLKYGDSTANVHVFQKTYMQTIIDSYRNNYCEREFDTIPQTVIAFGGVAFASSPFELFSQIGLQIDKFTPNVAVLSTCCSNGNRGYFITEDAICRGGYEVHMFLHHELQPYVDNADWHLMKETVKHIESMNL